MGMGVVNDGTGHFMVNVLGSSGLLSSDFRQRTFCSFLLQCSPSVAVVFLERCRIWSKAEHLPGVGIGQRGDVPDGVPVHADHAVELLGECRGIIRIGHEPVALALKELHMTNGTNDRLRKCDRQNALSEESGHAKAIVFELHLFAFVTADGQHQPSD